MMKVFYCFGISMLLIGMAVLAAQSQCVPTYPIPKLIGTLRSGIGNTDLVVKGETAFLSTQRLSPEGELIGVLQSIDVSNPAYPQVIESTDLIGKNPDKMVLKQNFLYIISMIARGGPYIYCLEVFDVSNPRSPQPVGNLTLNDTIAVSIGIKDNAVYIHDDMESDDLAEEIMVVDVSDPANPKYVRSVPMIFLVHEIYVHGNLALLANAGAGLSVLDVTTPLDPIFLSTFRLQDWGVADVTAKGQYAFFPIWGNAAETFSEFVVVDLTNPSQIELTASIEIGKPLTDGWSIALEGTLAVVVSKEDPDSGYITLIDISDPRSPQERGRADTPDEIGGIQGGVVMQNGLIYVCAFEGLVIYEIVYR